MSTQDKKVKIVIDTDFNNNKITNAKIDADENELIGIGKIDNVQVNGESVVEGQVANISMATVAISGSYTDLINKPIIPDPQVNSDWNSDSGVSEILNKPALTTVALTGDYNDLINKPVVGNATLIIQKNSSNIGTFTANATVNNTINVEVPTSTNDLVNDSDFQTSEDVNSAISLHNSSNTAHSDIRQDISNIDELIPAQASSTNKLADKNFVNSSIATNTANFIGTFNSVEELEEYSGPVTNNDYAFVISEDESGNTSYNRYKYNSSEAEWIYEYTLNNSSFTSDQWAAINSGITTNKVTNYDNHLSDTNNPHSVTKEQVGLGNVDNTSDLSKPISTATQNALNAKQDTIDSNHKLDASLISNLATVATTGSYNDLLNTPTIPTVNDSTITITQDGTTKGTFTLNQSTNATINLDASGNVEDVQVNGDSVVESGIANINLKTINNQDIVGEGNLEIQGGSELNEFVITQEIFDEYKNENNYADLADIISSEEITQNVINLNNFNFFLNNLTVSNKTLIFKNGTVVFGTSGISDSIDKAITASNCKIGFIDCELRINSTTTTEPEKPVMDLNNTNLTFDNVIADNFIFTTFKTFIQTTNTCNIVLKDTLFNVENRIVSYDPEIDERRPSVKFIKVLTNGSSIEFVNSMVDIRTNNLIGEEGINEGLCQNIIVWVLDLYTAKLQVINSILQIIHGGHGEGGISSRPSRCFDVNLDNLDVVIVNSTIYGSAESFSVRNESSYALKIGKQFTTSDPYMIYLEPNIDTFPEDYEHIIENIDCDKYVIADTVNYIEGDYHFTYNGSSWDIKRTSFDDDDESETVIATDVSDAALESDYGITYELVQGKTLTQGDSFTAELTTHNQPYKILKNFTAEGNTPEYLDQLNYYIEEIVIPEDEQDIIDTVNYNRKKFADGLAATLERNGLHLKPHTEYDEDTDTETPVMAKIGFWYDEDNDDPNVWKIEIDSEWIEEDDHLMDDVNIVDDFGLEVVLHEGQTIPNLLGFTVIVEPCIEKTEIYIKENINSVFNGGDYGDEEYFPVLEENDQPLGIFSGKEPEGFTQFRDLKTKNIKTETLTTTGNYYLPIHNENLESNNVKDAINELADKGTLSEENAGFSINIEKHRHSPLIISYEGLGISRHSVIYNDDEDDFEDKNTIDFNDMNFHVSKGSLIFKNGQLLEFFFDYIIDDDVLILNTNIELNDRYDIINGWNIFYIVEGKRINKLEIPDFMERRILIFKNGVLLAQDYDYEVEPDSGIINFFTEIQEEDKLCFVRTTSKITRKDDYYSNKIFTNEKDLLVFKDGILLTKCEDEEAIWEEGFNYDYVYQKNPNYNDNSVIDDIQFNTEDIESDNVETKVITIKIITDDMDLDNPTDGLEDYYVRVSKHDEEQGQGTILPQTHLIDLDYEIISESESENPESDALYYYVKLKNLNFDGINNNDILYFELYQENDEEEKELEYMLIDFVYINNENNTIRMDPLPYSLHEHYQLFFQDNLDNSVISLISNDVNYGIFNRLSDKQDALTGGQLEAINNPYKPNLFDIKTIITPNAEENKGWACTCYDEPHKLNENQVAEAYNTIKIKLENADKYLSDWNDGNNEIFNIRYNTSDEKYYYLKRIDDHNGNLCRASNLDLTDEETLISNIDIYYDPTFSICVVNDENYFIFIIPGWSYPDLIVYDKNYNEIYNQSVELFPNAFINLNNSNKLFSNVIEGDDGHRFVTVLTIEDGQVTKEDITLTENGGKFGNMIIHNNEYYTCSSTILFKINPDNLTVESETFDDESNEVYVDSGVGYITINNDNLTTICYGGLGYKDSSSTIITGHRNRVFSLIDNEWQILYSNDSSIGEIFKVENFNNITYMQIQNNGITNLQSTENFEDFDTIYENVNDFNSFDNGELVVFDNNNVYHYSGISTKIYTDTINGIDINYYKSGDWKICIAGQNNRDDGEDENDGKLQDVYNYLGYLPYFWIDQGNLDIVLPRNSNRWTMMYVGNDYVEEEMPEGNYSAFATKDELRNKKEPKIFQSDYYETVEIVEQHDIEGDIVINQETYLSQVTDDWKDNIFTYNGSDWVDEEENIVGLQTYGIDVSGTTYSEGSKFFVYSACLRNKDTYTAEIHIDIISVYVNGILQIKKRDYTIDENNVITFNNYTLKSTDNISVLGYNMEGEE